MGREAVALVHWRGAVDEVRALLEAQEIILRGAIRARLARAGISQVSAEDGCLTCIWEGERLVIELGEREAAKWRDALLKPPPSLAAKLGIGPESRAFVMGDCSDPEFNQALSGLTCQTPDAAQILVAIIQSDSGLATAHATAQEHPDLLLWCVYPKGKNAAPGDTAVRAFLRARGYIDTKSCAVSARLTATRYGRKVSSA